MVYRKAVRLGLAFVFVALLMVATAWSQVSRTSVPPTVSNAQNRLPPGETGTYQLMKVAKAGGDELYRINTKTGQVWLYSEFVVLDSESVGATGLAKDGLDKLIAEARRQGKNVYTAPFWDATAEMPSTLYTIH
jgi:hypothetical protein